MGSNHNRIGLDRKHRLKHSSQVLGLDPTNQINSDQDPLFSGQFEFKKYGFETLLSKKSTCGLAVEPALLLQRVHELELVLPPPLCSLDHRYQGLRFFSHVFYVNYVCDLFVFLYSHSVSPTIMLPLDHWHHGSILFSHFICHFTIFSL